MKTTLFSVTALLSSVNAVAVSFSSSIPDANTTTTSTTSSSTSSLSSSSSSSLATAAAGRPILWPGQSPSQISSSSSSSAVPMPTPIVAAAGRPVLGSPSTPTTTAVAGRPNLQAAKPATTANTALSSLYCAVFKICPSTTTPAATPKTTSTTSTRSPTTTKISTTSSTSTSTTTSSSKTSSTTSTTSSTTSTTTRKTSTSITTSTTSSTTSTTTRKTSSTTSTTSTRTTSSTTTTSAAATVLPANLNGCFLDYYPTSRAMSGASFSSDAMTPQVCATFCTNSGYEYSGVEYGNQCYCAHAWPSTWTTNCNMKCAGDSTKFCGGSNALNVMYTAASTAVTTSSKRGLAWPWNNDPAIFKLFDPTKETWVYNWEMWSPTGFLSSYAGAQYVGLVRSPARLGDIASYYKDGWQTSPILLGFNEPDLAGSDTYVTVSDAVTYWKQYFLPLRAKYGTKLGAPAVTNGVGTNWGLDWLNKFNAACSDTSSGTAKSCFDFIPLHWYGNSFSSFQSWVVAFHNAYPTYDLWITEFAFTDVDAATSAVLVKQAINWLDTQSYVARYALFGPMDAANMAGITAGAMVNDAHTALTQVGKVYAGLA